MGVGSSGFSGLCASRCVPSLPYHKINLNHSPKNCIFLLVVLLVHTIFKNQNYKLQISYVHTMNLLKHASLPV